MTKDVFIKEVRDAEAMLYHISKSILKNDSDCGDAVQETILKAYEKLPTLKKEKYFRTWITRILINECKGILRKRKNVIPYEEYMDNMRLTEEDRYSHLYMAIMELPEELRVLVTLYYLEGFSQKEISEALDLVGRARFLHCLHGYTEHRGPDFIGIMLYPAWLRKILVKFTLCHAAHFSFFVK